MIEEKCPATCTEHQDHYQAMSDEERQSMEEAIAQTAQAVADADTLPETPSVPEHLRQGQEIRRPPEAMHREPPVAEASSLGDDAMVRGILWRISQLEKDVKSNDYWVLTASKDRLKQAARVERERADRLAVLLRNSEEMLAAALRREEGYQAKIQELLAPLESVCTNLTNAQTRVIEQTAVLEKMQSTQTALHDQILEQLKAQTAIAEKVGADALAVGADLVHLRDDLNARVGTLKAAYAKLNNRIDQV